MDLYHKNKVPDDIREYFKKEKNKNYNKMIDINQPIKNQNLMDETLAIIAMLNLKYWCDDEEEKKRLINIYLENERKINDELKEKYDIERVFKERNSKKELNFQDKGVPDIRREGFFSELKNRILNFFKK